MSRAVLALLASLLFSALAPVAVAGDRWVEVTLQDGSMLVGAVIEVSEEGYLLRTSDGERFLRHAECRSASFFEEEPRAASTPAPLSRSAQWVVVRRQDDTPVSGSLISQGSEGVAIQMGTERLMVPWDQVIEIVFGELSADGQPLPAPPPAHARPTLSMPPPAPPRIDYRGLPGWDAYQQDSLRLVDRRGRPIGPRELGFYQDPGRASRKTFAVVHPSEARDRLTVAQFVELVQDPDRTNAFERAIFAVKQRRGRGAVLSAVGAGLLTLGIGTAIALQAQQGAGVLPGLVPESSPELLLVGLGFGAGIPLLTAGLATLIKADKEEGDLLRDPWLDELFGRPEAYESVQDYNSSLRQELGIPDREEADSPDN